MMSLMTLMSQRLIDTGFLNVTKVENNDVSNVTNEESEIKAI